MLKCCCLLLNVAVVLSAVDVQFSDITNQYGSRFRLDYDNFPEVEGWMKLHRIPATWMDAYLNCYYEGAVLASPENLEIWRVMRMILSDEQRTSKMPTFRIFTGIHAWGKGSFFSIEGTPLARMPGRWSPGQPDNFGNAQDCILMQPNGTINDVGCSEIHPYICYKKTRAVRLNDCGTVDDAYTLDNRTGQCYKVHTDPLNWSRANVACAREGGHLAIINSDLEAQVLKKLYSKAQESMVPGNYDRGSAFLGMRNFEGNFLWMTIQGQTLKDAGYDKWATGQPDFNGEACGTMFPDGQLDDTGCFYVLPFICEKDPSSLLSKPIDSAIQKKYDTEMFV